MSETNSPSIRHDQFDPQHCPEWCGGDHLRSTPDDAFGGWHHDSPGVRFWAEMCSDADPVSVSVSQFQPSDADLWPVCLEVSFDGHEPARLRPAEARKLALYLLTAVEVAGGASLDEIAGPFESWGAR